MTEPNPTETQEDTQSTFDEWAKIELFGHNVAVGRVRETTMAGGAFLRLDVPTPDGNGVQLTQFLNPKSIYAITKEVALKMLP